MDYKEYKCGCGNEDFDIQESIVHRASFSDEGILETYKFKDNEISGINCTKCGKSIMNQYNKNKFEVEFCD